MHQALKRSLLRPLTKPPTLRFVGQYTCNFSASTTATATVPAADLKLPASPTKQILVIGKAEVPTLVSATINGVAAAYVADRGNFVNFFSATYAGSGPFNVVLTASASNSENGRIEVYEVDNAAPLHQGCLNGVAGSGTSGLIQARAPNNGCLVAGAIHTTDTVAISWTAGLTLDVDADAGDYRGSSGSDINPSIGNRDVDVTLGLGSAAAQFQAASLAINPSVGNFVSGGFRSITAVNGVTTTATFSSIPMTNFTASGSFKLFAFFIVEANVTFTSATFNGNGMTAVGSIVNTGATPDISIHVFSIDVTQAAPSGNIIVTASGSIDAIPVALEVACMYNVRAVGAVQTAQGNATGAAVNVAVAEGGTILAFNAKATTGLSVAWTGVREVFDGTLTGMSLSSAIQPFAAAEASRTVQAVSSSDQYCTLAFACNP